MDRSYCFKSNLKIEFVSDTAFHLGEGPFWDSETNILYQVDTFVGDFVKLNVTTGRTDKYNLKDYISVVIPISRQKNRFIISRRNQLLEFDSISKSERIFANVGKEKFNDGKVDGKGRLWIGTLKNYIYESNEGAVRNGGALYRLDGQKLTRITTMSLPNGMAWSLNNKFFYIADTIERQIYVYNFDLKSGQISNKRILLDFNNNSEFEAQELPDGMAIDKNGKLWIAVIFGARLIQIDPKTGNIERSIATPANQTTSIAFGGPHFKHMFVTTGNRDLTEDQKKEYPNIGKTLRITADYIQGPGPAFKAKLD